jgi:glutaminyl-peptide cyclotransferase
VAQLVPEVLAVYPHDDSSYTQGLVVDPAGRVFESAGRYGRSNVREVDVASGRVLRRRDLPDEVFGEGLAYVEGRLVVLTWREGRAFVLDAGSLESVGEHAYDGQGWGLCFDGERLVMSDGSATLTFRDPATFAVRGSVTVTTGGVPLPRLNELDCVDGTVWANVYLTDRIVQIDPGSGRVLAEVDAAALSARQEDREADEVLNGIAWDPARGTFLVTGKHWDELYEVRFVPR